MRTYLGIMLAATVSAGVPLSVRADDRDKAVAVIEQAIKAHGGAEALNKAQKRSRNGGGVIVLNKNEVPFKTEEMVSFPDRCRVDLDLGRTRLMVVLNGDKGWMQAGGSTQPMDRGTFTERRDELYVWWLMTLTPLLKDGFELKPLADARINDHEAAVVKVSRKGQSDLRLFFDKKSGLLIKISRRGENAGVPITLEYQYSDHKDFDGVKWPVREVTTMNGNKLSEV